MADFNYSLLCKNVYVSDLCSFYQLILVKGIVFSIENNNWLKPFWQVERFPPLDIYCKNMVKDLKELIIKE